MQPSKGIILYSAHAFGSQGEESSGLQVFGQRCPILCELDHALTERLDVALIENQAAAWGLAFRAINERSKWCAKCHASTSVGGCLSG